ncbi:Shootin-1 [Dirofilaria immitis]
MVEDGRAEEIRVNLSSREEWTKGAEDFRRECFVPLRHSNSLLHCRAVPSLLYFKCNPFLASLNQQLNYMILPFIAIQNDWK